MTWSDIENKAEYSASSSGIGYGWGNPTTTINGKEIPNPSNGISPNIGVTASGSADSTTKSAISLGTIEVRSNPAVDLSGLSRDTGSALNALGKIFDKKTVAEQQELAKVFGEVAFKAIGDLGLPEGSAEKAALDAVFGGIMAKLGGGSFASGAAGAVVPQILMNELANITDPAVLQWAGAILGAAAAKLVGGDAQTGASVGASEIKNNFIPHIFAAAAVLRALAASPAARAVLTELGILTEAGTINLEAATRFFNWARLTSQGIKHITNRHGFDAVKEQLTRIAAEKPDLLENYIGSRTFFNKSWSSDKIVEAVETGRVDLIRRGITDGTHLVEVFGEKIEIVLERGNLVTAYGKNVYTLADFGF